MTRFLVSLVLFLSLNSLILTENSDARYWHRKAASPGQAESETSAKAKGKEKPFDVVIKDYEKVEGLFDFYVDTTENSVYLAIKPNQFEETYLANITRSAGDGTYYDASSQAGTFPFMFKRIGKQVQLLIVNVLYRADDGSPLQSAIERSISHSVFGSTKIASEPDKSGAVLIDPASILITDVPNAGYFLGKEAKTGFRFDKENSYFGPIMSFPENSEIDVVLHYQTDQPSKSVTTGSPYSMILTYHYSLSSIPESDYRPRLADDRVGYFLTQYQDYTDLSMESPYVRFIERWHLKKQDPAAATSEVVEPIVFWVENTVPEEYRELIARGIEWWQPAFERAGLKNAIIAKQMPDTASWDPADVRYSVIRWVVSPGKTYASGPSRANPFTGQIYDADIRIMADFIRSMYIYAESYVEPLASDVALAPEDLSEEAWPLETQYGQWKPCCSYGHESALRAAEELAVVEARSSLAGKPELTRKFVEQYIVELVAHEVGHTLGLRHNFKGSTIISREQRCDPEFTRVHSVHGSVMEYAPANVAPPGMEQADFFMMIPGPYDYWAIEYGYKPIEAVDFWGERPALDQIASLGASDPRLVYATDEDCFGNSPRAIDPYATLWDLGDDALEYWNDRIAMSRELWASVEQLFEKPGTNYKRLRNVFQYGWGGFRSSGLNVARFIGGIEHRRDHVGGKLPFAPIPAEQQRAAMTFLREKIWAGDVFDFRPELVNKLQPERMPDFSWSVYKMTRVDYPLHNQILDVQMRPLRHIYDPVTLSRLNDIEMHYGSGEEIYTMTDVFQDVRRAIWTPEVTSASNINSFRRNLQRLHLNYLVQLITDKKLKVPEDARTLARVDMKVLKNAIGRALGNQSLNTITRGHLEESLARIDAAMAADMEYKM